MRISDDAEQRILDKAEYVEAAVSVLARKQELDEAAYRDDREHRAVVEREFQTSIEACIDIAGVLLSALDEPMPETNAGRFSRLGELDIRSSETSEHMRNAAGFRNILTHKYGTDIDDTLVYRHLQNELEWIVIFLREVRQSLADEPPDAE